MRNLEGRISEVKAIKRFGEELGLDFGEAFEILELEKTTPFYWLYASYKDRIEPPPLRGRNGWDEGRPYNLYKSSSSARRRARDLEEQGFDTLIRSTEVYGGSDCPITLGLLEKSLVNKAGMILHEGFHMTHRKKGWKLPYRLNEGIASVFGNSAAVSYLEENAPHLTEEMLKRQKWWLDYARFITRCHDKVQDSGRSGKNIEEILEQANEESRQLTKSYGYNFGYPITTAFLLSQRDYIRDTELIWNTLKDVNLREYLANPDEVHAYLLEQIGEKRDG